MQDFLDGIYKSGRILPKREDVFKALFLVKPEEVKVIIIGQDPYPNAKDAMGLAFSVPHNKIPASLRNVFKELSSDLKIPIPKIGDLTPWADRGVLLLNSILTVEEGKSLSHANKGWEHITNNLIQKVIDKKNPIVIMAWGKYAQDKLNHLKLHDRVLVLKGGHPSPLNRANNFLGKKYFSEANNWLIKHTLDPINWSLDES
jgi:uracil-DNA glycosylase